MNIVEANAMEALPPVVFGTSGLGNLYTVMDDETKQAVVSASIISTPGHAVFDSAGKYGAGLALESLGKSLHTLGVDPSKVTISNKLGWYRIPLKTAEPTFEPGVWKNIGHDAEQRISYNGILECYEQGNELLGKYRADYVSVHDPDEYLAAAKDKEEQKKRWDDILEAYEALFDLKALGKVKAVGVGSKDWRVIKAIANEVKLDWVMIANSMTLHSHPYALLSFMEDLKLAGIPIINSAIFNGGFLTGGDFYNYKPVDPETTEGKDLLLWRKQFLKLCQEFGIEPAHACVQFGINAPGVHSLAMSTTRPGNVQKNVGMATTPIDNSFWNKLVEHQLVQYSFASI